MSASGASQQQVAPRPLCPDSDQILHLAEMTRWAISGRQAAMQAFTLLSTARSILVTDERRHTGGHYTCGAHSVAPGTAAISSAQLRSEIRAKSVAKIGQSVVDRPWSIARDEQ